MQEAGLDVLDVFVIFLVRNTCEQYPLTPTGYLNASLDVSSFGGSGFLRIPLADVVEGMVQPLQQDRHGKLEEKMDYRRIDMEEKMTNINLCQQWSELDPVL